MSTAENTSGLMLPRIEKWCSVEHRLEFYFLRPSDNRYYQINAPTAQMMTKELEMTIDIAQYSSMTLNYSMPLQALILNS